MGHRELKIVAFYLPQFHQIPENDKWWGEGFTDWVNVKRATPLFDGHYQPRTPHPDIGYYDPSQPGVLEKQAKIAREHGIHGFCFYHYWFDGKLLLEKPLERLLANPQIDLPFCICWANEPWTRAWDGKQANVLMPQHYGGEAEWTKHFEYLSRAFHDPRAIKVEGKPVILIYRIGNIPDANKMILHWKNMAMARGLPGLHVVAMLTGFTDSREFEGCDIDAVCEFHPTYALKPMFRDYFFNGNKIGLYLRAFKKFLPFLKNVVTTIKYKDLWERILSLPKIHDTQYLGACVSWDNSPRKGAQGMILDGSSPSLFQYYLSKQVQRVLADRSQEPLLMINAWNEWAEGAYLEPDTMQNYKYLEAVRAVAINQQENGSRDLK
jgi:glycosyl transferase family WbsX